MSDLPDSDEIRESFADFRDHIDALEVEKTERVELARDQTILCGDDGKQVSFRGRCPKCGTEEWIPAASPVTPMQRKALVDAGLLKEIEE